MGKNDSIHLLLCHTTAGRVRIKAPVLRGQKRRAEILQERLLEQKCFLRADVRAATGSIILHFTPDRMAHDVILTSVQNQIAVLPETVGPDDRKSLPERGGWTKPLVYHFVNAAVLGGLLLYALMRRFLFRSPLSQRPFSFTGAAAIIGTFPLFYRALSSLRSQGMGLYPFLTFAVGLAILTGEALTALEIIWILSVGMFLEEYAVERARTAIREILQVAPARAVIIQNGTQKEIPVEAIQKGDTVVVGFGRTIPVDGSVIAGEALVDEAHITGRAHPEHRRCGDPVYAGTQVQQGALSIRAEKIGEETYLCHMTNLVEAALSTRTDIEKRADVLAVRLTRAGVVSTILTYILTGSMTRSFSVLLVVSCPCATVLAASTAVAAGIANAARKQILIKSGRYLEQVFLIDSICFDKTGTITAAYPEIAEILSVDPSEESGRVLSLAAGAEACSDHPMAKIILKAAREQNVDFTPASESEAVIGRGVRAFCDSDTILIGNEDFLSTEGVDLSFFQKASARHMTFGNTVVYVAENKALKGMIAISNAVRPETGGVIERLNLEGIHRIFLISGDTEPVVKHLADNFGFTDYAAPILPEEKAQFIEQLEQSGRRVLMVGDGVNDALALSKATVGVAMGAGGSAVAVEAADIALVDGDLGSLLRLRQLSKKTLETVEANFWIATATNIAGIILGAAGWLPPVMAGFLHMGHTLGIMLNTGRLLQWEDGSTGSSEKSIV